MKSLGRKYTLVWYLNTFLEWILPENYVNDPRFNVTWFFYVKRDRSKIFWIFFEFCTTRSDILWTLRNPMKKPPYRNSTGKSLFEDFFDFWSKCAKSTPIGSGNTRWHFLWVKRCYEFNSDGFESRRPTSDDQWVVRSGQNLESDRITSCDISFDSKF